MKRHEASVLRAYLIVMVTIAVAGLRMAGLKSPSFQAIAHLWVGYLIGAAHGVKVVNGWWDLGLLGAAVMLTVVETICFLAEWLG